MSYRDDLGAATARAEAAEREAERLRMKYERPSPSPSAETRARALPRIVRVARFIGAVLASFMLAIVVMRGLRWLWHCDDRPGYAGHCATRVGQNRIELVRYDDDLDNASSVIGFFDTEDAAWEHAAQIHCEPIP